MNKKTWSDYQKAFSISTLVERLQADVGEENCGKN
jgi:hypothetical protein